MNPLRFSSAPVLHRRARHVSVAAVLQDALEHSIAVQLLEFGAAADPPPADEDLSNDCKVKQFEFDKVRSTYIHVERQKIEQFLIQTCLPEGQFPRQ